MKIKFKDDTLLSISTPVENKIFGRDNIQSGWVINFSILSNLTGAEIDSILTVANIENLVLLSDDEEITKNIDGYDKITSCLVRYKDVDGISTSIEVQFSKGL
jgi:hypothetical protein